MSAPELSVVVPVYNEAGSLPELHLRLHAVLEALGKSYEVIYVDDGSSDRSLDILCGLGALDPRVCVVELFRNFGQHAAVMAGLERSGGRTVLTLDSDLQNPPEEIPKLLAELDKGFDVVGGWRADRRDPWWRRRLSGMLAFSSRTLFGSPVKDYGCMLRAYRREIVEQVLRCGRASLYVPALANSFAKRASEIPVRHDLRRSGVSKYGPWRLLRLNFDLLTGFSLLPIQAVSLLGAAVASGALAWTLALCVRRVLWGPPGDATAPLFSLVFFLIGLQILSLGLIGEYVGRIYREGGQHSRFAVRRVHRLPDGLEAACAEETPGAPA